MGDDCRKREWKCVVGVCDSLWPFTLHCRLSAATANWAPGGRWTVCAPVPRVATGLVGGSGGL